jgi:mRNA interferase RelE/StbE
VADYRVTIKPSAARDLDNLDASVATRILLKTRALGTNPRPAGVKKIKGERDLWRIRVGDWRVINPR